MVELSPEECRGILSRNRLCVLSLVDDAEPYAIPLFYGFDGESMILGISEGLKTRIIDRNPRSCAAITEIGGADEWASVLVFGEARWIAEPDERRKAIQVLKDHNRKFRSAAPAADAEHRPAARSHGSGRVMELRGARITGRAKR
jgi:uncharacterized protein